MSPAGMHTHGRVTPYLHYIGRGFYEILPYFTSHISMPDCLISLAAKLQQDMMTPASSDLLAYLASLILGGDSKGETFVQSARVVHSVLQFGFSLGIPR